MDVLLLVGTVRRGSSAFLIWVVEETPRLGDFPTPNAEKKKKKNNRVCGTIVWRRHGSQHSSHAHRCSGRVGCVVSSAMASHAAGEGESLKLSHKVQRLQLAKVVPLNTDDEPKKKKKKPPLPSGAGAPDKPATLSDDVKEVAEVIKANQTAVIECCAHFDHFGVAGMKVVAEAIAAIPPGNSVLTHLTLDGNWFKDEGAQILSSSLPRIRGSLKVLELRDNKMNDEGIVALCKALSGSKCLEKLSVSGNRVGTRGAKAIAKLAIATPTLVHVLLLHCEDITLPAIATFAKTVLTMDNERPLTFFEGLEWLKLREPFKFKKPYEFDAEVLAYLKDLRNPNRVQAKEKLLRMEQNLQKKWIVGEIDKAESFIQTALQTENEQAVRFAVDRARGMECPDDSAWMQKAIAFIKECVAARKREIAERKRRRRWRRQEKARREREFAERQQRELEEALERDKKPRGLLMFTLLFGFCCFLTACGLRPAFLNAKDRMTYVVARLNVCCFVITFAFGVFILYLIVSGDDEWIRSSAATVLDAATDATSTVVDAAGANISTDINANVDGHTFEPCQDDDLMPALHFYTSIAACEARVLAVTQFLPFETPQTCDGDIVSTVFSVGDTPCADDDSDGVCDFEDSCPNDSSNDPDDDGICEFEDSCPGDARNDRDTDGVCDLNCETLGGDSSTKRDGSCDTANNINACGWDGGDCVPSTCETYDNGDPWPGDGACDIGTIDTNTAECSWDAGDCCDPAELVDTCIDPFGDRPCVGEWGEWGECPPCGKHLTRQRTFVVSEAATGEGHCLHNDGYVSVESCVDPVTICDSDSDGIDDESDSCTCDNSTGICPPDAENPDIDSDSLCDVGFDPCIDGVWLVPQTEAATAVETGSNDADRDGICDVVDSCVGDALNDANGDGICDGSGLNNVAYVPPCVPIEQCPRPLASFCNEFNSSGPLFMRLSCDEVCLRNSVVQRQCDDETFSTEQPLLPVERAYVGLPSVVNLCVESEPGSGIWIHSECTEFVPELGHYSDSNCTVRVNISSTSTSPDFRNRSVIDSMSFSDPDPVC